MLMQDPTTAISTAGTCIIQGGFKTGMIITGACAGTLAYQWAQLGSTAFCTLVKAGSWMGIRKAA